MYIKFSKVINRICVTSHLIRDRPFNLKVLLLLRKQILSAFDSVSDMGRTNILKPLYARKQIVSVEKK